MDSEGGKRVKLQKDGAFVDQKKSNVLVNLESAFKLVCIKELNLTTGEEKNGENH